MTKPLTLPKNLEIIFGTEHKHHLSLLIVHQELQLHPFFTNTFIIILLFKLLYN